MIGRRPESLLISKNRKAGYLSALRKHGLPVEDEYQIHINFRTESAVAALDMWLALPEPPDAIFAINYTNAIDLIQSLKQRGLHVPEDIAVVGFGDEFMASMMEPGLTTVNLHPYRIGQQAARLFLEQVRQKEDFQRQKPCEQGFRILNPTTFTPRPQNCKLPIGRTSFSPTPFS